MLPDDIKERIQSRLGVEVSSSTSVGGGCIANATRVQTGERDLFVKWSRGEAARTFRAEADGLAALREAGSPLVIPETLHVDRDCLVLQWIESGARAPDFWQVFGRGLAILHRHTAERFGFSSDNFIGRLPQENTWSETWTEFFQRCRIEPQVRRARENGRWDASWNRSLESLYAQLSRIIPADPPASMLHGDLWGGNFMVDAGGRAVLIDPAAYYGHREADLAMTQLFGGFDAAFYDAYAEEWPLGPGYEERREVYNLYHLINHLNHFGGGYGNSVAGILGRF